MHGCGKGMPNVGGDPDLQFLGGGSICLDSRCVSVLGGGGRDVRVTLSRHQQQRPRSDTGRHGGGVEHSQFRHLLQEGVIDVGPRGSLGAQAIGEGQAAAGLMANRQTVAEGAHTAPVLQRLARAEGIDMPIVDAVVAMLEGAKAADVADALLARPLTTESRSA